MKKFFLLIYVLFLSGCAVNLVDIKITADCTYDMNESYIALQVPTKSIFYNTKLHLYRLDTLDLVQKVSYNEENQAMGFYNDGYYTISLNKNIAYLYLNNGSIRKIVINNRACREQWNDAYLSYDAKEIYFLKGRTLYAWAMETEKVSEIYTFDEDIVFLASNEQGIYVSQQQRIFKINNQEVEEVNNIDYVDSHFYIRCINEKDLQITNSSTNEMTNISLKSSNEEIVFSNSNGILTCLESSVYYYALNEQYVYRFDIENVESAMIDEQNNLYVVLDDVGIKKYTLEDSVKVSMILDWSKNETTQHQMRGAKLIEAPIIAQLPNYPTGCEAISTVMLLRYLGEDIALDTFIDKYLDKGEITEVNGVIYAPNPYKVFPGDPKTEVAFGCMVPVIEEAVNQYFGSNKYIENTTGLTLEQLCDNYIDRDYPVVVWASLNMIEFYESQSWITPEGDTYTWLANEHCLLLVGYDEDYYYFNDPWTGKVQAYNKDVCEKRYETLGKQSLTILKK